MSFILDALRKSEAARRRNEAPDLFARMPDAPVAHRERSAWPMWLVGGIGIAALAVSLWLALHRAPEGGSTRTATATDATSAPPVAPPPGPPAPAAPTQAGARPMPGPRPDAVPNIGPASVPNAAAIEAPAAAARAQPAPVVAVPTDAALPAPLPAQRPDIARARTPSPAAVPSPVPPPDAAAPATAPAPRSALRLSDLDPGTRKSLPPLKMSMHMWNEDGARRFVILDGQRLGEGDMLGDVMVESITRDGVVLNWQGSRLRLDTR